METMEISPFFALDAEDLIRDGSLAEALELCILGVSAYPDYPAGYCVLADIYWEGQEYEKSYDVLEKAAQRFPGNRAIIAKIDLFSIKVREISKENHPGTISVVAPENEAIPYGDESLVLESTVESGSEDSENNDYLQADQPSSQEDINPLFYRKSFIRHLPFDVNTYRKNDLLRARNLSLIPGLESSPLISSGSRELSRNYIEEIASFPEPVSESLIKIKQLKLRNNQQSNIDISLFDDKYDDDEDIKPVAPVMTETLAKIYESQQLWATAISAYEILAERYPQNAESYQQKINELREKL